MVCHYLYPIYIYIYIYSVSNYPLSCVFSILLHRGIVTISSSFFYVPTSNCWNVIYNLCFWTVNTSDPMTLAVWLPGEATSAIKMWYLPYLVLLPSLCLVVGGVTHPMAPTCHGFGGIGYNCATAYPGDSGKRRGSGFGSTTYAVKVDLPGCFAKPCWLQEIRVGVDESNSVASLAKMGVYRSDGTLAKASETLQMPTSLQDHAWLSFTFLGYDNETWLKMKSRTGFESIILVQQKYVRLWCWFYSNFTEIAFPISLWFMICLLWFVMNYVLVVD